jgi:hypothetical protein
MAVDNKTQIILEAIDRVSKPIKDMTDDVSSSFGKITSIVGNITQAFVGLEALLKGGSLFSGAVNSANEFSSSTMMLARNMGVSTQEATGFALAFKNIGVDTDQLTTVMFRLAMSLKANEDTLRANGIATRDMSGALLPMKDILMNTITVINQMKEGADRNELSLTALGRSAKDLQGIMRMTSDRLAEGAVEADRLGIALGANAIVQTRQFKEASERLDSAFKSLSIRIGQDLQPELTKLIKSFTEFIINVAPSVISATAGILNFFTSAPGLAATLASTFLFILVPAINAATAAFLALSTAEDAATFGLSFLAKAAIVAGVTLGTYALTAGKTKDTSAELSDSLLQQAKTFSLTYRNYKETIPLIQEYERTLANSKKGTVEYSEANQKLNAQKQNLINQSKEFASFANSEGESNKKLSVIIEDYNKAIYRKLQSTIENISRQKNLTEANQEYLKVLQQQIVQIDNLNKAKSFVSKAELPSAEIQLQQQLLDIRRQAGLNTDNLLTLELAFFKKIQEEKFASFALKKGEEPKFASKIAEEVFKIEQELAKRQIKLNNETSRQKLQNDESNSALSLARLETDRAKGLLTEQAFYSGKQVLLNIDRLATQIYYSQLLSDASLSAEERLKLEIEAAKKAAEFKKQLATNNRDALMEDLAVTQALFEPLKTSFDESLKGMLSGTMTFSQALGNIWRSIGKVIDNFIVEMISAWLKKDAVSLASTIKTAVLGSAIQKAAATEEVLTKQATVPPVVGAEAAKGGAAATAWWSGVNPLVAIGAGLVIFAAISALANRKSAKGGWDFVPADGSLAELHKGEMVLPAYLAEGIRNIVGQGQTPAAVGGNNTFYIQAMDASSFDSYLKQNAQSVLNAQKLAIRNGGNF